MVGTFVAWIFNSFYAVSDQQVHEKQLILKQNYLCKLRWKSDLEYKINLDPERSMLNISLFIR